MHGGDGGQDDEPEPHQDEDLLVQDVLGKDAQRLPRLDGARGSEFLEAALRHSREGRGEGVVRFVVIQVEVYDLGSREKGEVRRESTGGVWGRGEGSSFFLKIY